MKDLPAPLVGFARIGLVLVLGIALWKPAEDLSPTGMNTVDETVPAEISSDMIVGSSLLTDLVDTVGSDESVSADTQGSFATLVR